MLCNFGTGINARDKSGAATTGANVPGALERKGSNRESARNLRQTGRHDDRLSEAMRADLHVGGDQDRAAQPTSVSCRAPSTGVSGCESLGAETYSTTVRHHLAES
jgi:hypothetical protein